MSDFSPNFLPRGEIIGDRSSSDYNPSLTPPSFPDPNSSPNILSKTIMYVLEFFLTIISVPFTACQRIYENDHLMIMLRVILEVSLELIMWLVLAGVSILTSAALIFDDLYSGKSGSEGYRRLVKNYADNEETRRDDLHRSSSNAEDDYSSKENESPEETVVQLREANCQRLPSPFPKHEARKSAEMESKTPNSYAPEKDGEDCVNFSFYKPIRRGFIAASADTNRGK